MNKNGFKYVVPSFMLIFGLCLLILATDSFADNRLAIALFGLASLSLGVLWIVAMVKKQNQIIMNAQSQRTNLIQQIISSIQFDYSKTYADITIPTRTHTITLENSESCNCWIDDGVFRIVTSLNSLRSKINQNPELYAVYSRRSYPFSLYQIPIENIEYFNVVGDFYTSTEISGGGSNLGGALVGGALFGTAGAIVGSKESVKSETQIHDHRSIELKYNETGQLKTIMLDKTSETVLKQLLPDKEYSYIMYQRNKE